MMLHALERAYEAEPREEVRRRVVDVMAYLHGLILYRDFEVVRDREQANRTDAFYDALLPVMRFLTRHSYRSMMCPNVLAMRYCNRTALNDGRPEFYWYRYEKMDPPQDPIWMDPEFPWRARPMVIRRGDPRVASAFHDDEVVLAFRADLARFAARPSLGNAAAEATPQVEPASP